jgi:hypothetical protein
LPPRARLRAALAAALLLAASPALAALPNGLPEKVTGPEISMLIRAAIVALHQANLTANYSVLHDLGDTRFQAAYSQSALSDMFRAFRDQHVNLEPAVLYDAVLDAPPKLTTDGLLRVVGHFSTTPQQVIFDITFRNQAGVWRLDALDAGMRPAPAPVAAVEGAPQAPAAAPVKPVALRAPIPLAPPQRQPAPPAAATADAGQSQSSFE